MISERAADFFKRVGSLEIGLEKNPASQTLLWYCFYYKVEKQGKLKKALISET